MVGMVRLVGLMLASRVTKASEGVLPSLLLLGSLRTWRVAEEVLATEEGAVKAAVELL
jgi:hypothetical protein